MGRKVRGSTVRRLFRADVWLVPANFATFARKVTDYGYYTAKDEIPLCAAFPDGHDDASLAGTDGLSYQRRAARSDSGADDAGARQLGDAA